MFIINLTYKVTLEAVDKYLKQHVEYLDEQYKAGKFIISGRKNPKVGGIIISTVSDEKELQDIIEKDPFKIHDLADYEIIEFMPIKSSEELKFMLPVKK